MIPTEQIDKAREMLETASEIIYFFDSDCDGTCSFLQLYNKYGGKGFVVKDGKKVSEKYLGKVEEHSPSLVVILDLPETDPDFNKTVLKQGMKILHIDHHPTNLEEFEGFMINPRHYQTDDSRSTSYWCAEITKDINWISMTGSITDYTFPEDHIKVFSKENEDLFPKKTKDIVEAMSNTKIGLLGKVIEANIKGKVKDAMTSVKILTRINDPYEILDQTSSKGKFLWKKYEKVRAYFDEIKQQINTKEDIIYYRYRNDDLSITTQLATEISQEFPKKIIFIVRDIRDRVTLSIRCQEHTINDVAQEASVGLDGKSDGHEHAVGGSFSADDFEIFLEKFKNKVKERIKP